jgi:hypothetical protein
VAASEPDPDEIRKCMGAVFASDGFADAPRLRDFLSYIVEEQLAGRGDRIVGKVVAASVYGRHIQSGRENDAIVRVEAGRLRSKLGAYYAGPGQGDPFRISVPTGSYRPLFETQKSVDQGVAGPVRGNVRLVAIAGLVSGLLVVLAWFASAWQPGFEPQDAGSGPASPPADQRIELERQAMIEKSPASLQAYDFSHQARDLIFPTMDPVRMRSTLAMFERAIELDEDNFGDTRGPPKRWFSCHCCLARPRAM